MFISYFSDIRLEDEDLDALFASHCNQSLWLPTVQRYWPNLHSTGVLDQSSQYKGTGQLSSFHLHLNPSKQFALNFAFCYGLNVLPADWYLRGLPVAEGLSHYDARLNRLCYAECARGALSFFFSILIESYGCISSLGKTSCVLL